MSAAEPGHADERILRGKSISDLETIFKSLESTWDRKAVAEIEAASRERVDAEYAEKATWEAIFSTPVNGKIPVDNRAVRSVIASWLNLDEVFSYDWFLRVLREQPVLANQITWEKFLTPQQARQAEVAQATEDRKTFEAAAKKLKSFGATEANFNLVKLTLTPGFTVDDIRLWVERGLAVSPASAAEIFEWTREEKLERADYLRHNASDTELRQAANYEFETTRAAARAEEDRLGMAAQRQQFEAGNYDPLPTHRSTDGVELNAAFFNRLPADQLRQFCRRYHSYQITKRLRGMA
jgi:hypothetical protein